MSSDSELSEAPVDEQVIENTLREIVREGQVDPVTVNAVRTAVEKRLGLAPGFFKDGEWKARSKDVINGAFHEPSSQQQAPSPAPSPPPKQTKKHGGTAPAKPTKRSPTDNAPQNRKKQKLAVSESRASDVEEPNPEPKKSTQAKGRARRPSVVSSGSGPDSDEVDSEHSEQKADAQDDGAKAEVDSESEMSVVLDEAPPPKKRRQKSAGADTSAKPKAKAGKASKVTKPSKASAGSTKDVDPDEAEIKRLQGWLVKCGIRKLWHRELAPYESPKAKIKHLKDMLRDAGMEGRYSVEKASKIKEQRELAADLEAVQEGAKKWGNEGEDGSSEAEEEPKPRRRAAAAARFVDFGDEEDDDDDDDE